LLPLDQLTKLIPFPARRVQRYAERLLIYSASKERLSAPPTWINRPVPPERLGNMLQRLQLRSPVTVLFLENVVAEVLAHLDR
jgi:hypothetical protein